MKKIKGGKRAGAGRKPTGKNTQVVSFSIPKKLVDEIKKIVKEKLLDLATSGVVISHTNERGEVKRIEPLSEEGLVVQQIANYEAEIKTLGTGVLGIKRKKFLENQIYNLKNKLK